MTEMSQRDRYILVSALAKAVEVINRLPQRDKPLNDHHDMKQLLNRLTENEVELSVVTMSARRKVSTIGTGRAWG